MKKKLKLVFLAGAGAVGKTSVANELARLGREPLVQCKVKVLPSTTRASYAAVGVDSEVSAASLSPEDMFVLQERIFSDYTENLVRHVDLALSEGTDVLVVDRSPYDYTSYLLCILPTLSLALITKRTEKTIDTLTSVVYKDNVKAFLWFFPYPTSWSTDGVEQDSFRRNPPAKNLVWSTVLDSMLSDLPANLAFGITQERFSKENAMDATDRAYYILKRINSDQAFPRP